MKIIHIAGKRHFDRNGNTYHSTQVFIDGEFKIYNEYEYGYDDHYKQTAIQNAIRKGILPERIRHENGTYDSIKEYGEKNNLKFSFSVADVSRLKDL
jgi:hypothetical protein